MEYFGFKCTTDVSLNPVQWKLLLLSSVVLVFFVLHLISGIPTQAPLQSHPYSMFIGANDGMIDNKGFAYGILLLTFSHGH